MTTVSVIIPTYNEERHIEETIRSLLNQDLKDLEIIVVDNGSRDRTTDIVANYANRYPERVRLIKLDFNAGPGGGRNIGAMSAKGDVLVFLDADMTFPPDFIRKLSEPILAGKCVATVHSKELVGNLQNPWVKVQGQEIKHMAPTDEWPGFRAISRKYFLERGGFDPSFGYHDDRFLKGGVKVKSVVVKDIFCYHYNPDTAYEIFRRNYWMGRTLIAISLYEGGLRGLSSPLYVVSARIIDLLALPSLVVAAVMLIVGNNPFAAIPLLLPSLIFFYLIARQRILNARSLSERAKLRLLYAPAYRLIRSAGILTGVVVSLIKGFKIRVGARTEP